MPHKIGTGLEKPKDAHSPWQAPAVRYAAYIIQECLTEFLIVSRPCFLSVLEVVVEYSWFRQASLPLRSRRLHEREPTRTILVTILLAIFSASIET